MASSQLIVIRARVVVAVRELEGVGELVGDLPAVRQVVAGTEHDERGSAGAARRIGLGRRDLAVEPVHVDVELVVEAVEAALAAVLQRLAPEDLRPAGATCGSRSQRRSCAPAGRPGHRRPSATRDARGRPASQASASRAWRAACCRRPTHRQRRPVPSPQARGGPATRGRRRKGERAQLLALRGGQLRPLLRDVAHDGALWSGVVAGVGGGEPAVAERAEHPVHQPLLGVIFPAATAGLDQLARANRRARSRSACCAAARQLPATHAIRR